MRVGAPIIGLNDSGGARIQEGVVSLGGYADIFLRNTLASGVVPQISVIMGPCAGGAVYSPAITDFTIMVEGTSYMFVTGPERREGRDPRGRRLASISAARSTHTAQQRRRASRRAGRGGRARTVTRAILGYLPQNNLDDAAARRDGRSARPRATPRSTRSSRTIRPSRTTCTASSTRVVDDGEFLEIQPNWAANIIVGFARIDGRSVGIVAQQPAVLAGALDIDASDKARAVRPHVRRVQRAAR